MISEDGETSGIARIAAARALSGRAHQWGVLFLAREQVHSVGAHVTDGQHGGGRKLMLHVEVVRLP